MNLAPFLNSHIKPLDAPPTKLFNPTSAQVPRRSIIHTSPFSSSHPPQDLYSNNLSKSTSRSTEPVSFKDEVLWNR